MLYRAELDTDAEVQAAARQVILQSKENMVPCYIGQKTLKLIMLLFEPNVFKSVYAKELIEYVCSTYGDELEFLWQKFPDNAIWRRKDTGKWYGALLHRLKAETRHQVR